MARFTAMRVAEPARFARAELWTAAEVVQSLRASLGEGATSASDTPAGTTDRWLRGPVGRRAIPPIEFGGHVRYHPYHVSRYLWNRRVLAFRGEAAAWSRPLAAFEVFPDLDEFAWRATGRMRSRLWAVRQLLERVSWRWHTEIDFITEELGPAELQLRTNPSVSPSLLQAIATSEAAVRGLWAHYRAWGQEATARRAERRERRLARLERKKRKEELALAPPRAERVVSSGVLVRWMEAWISQQRRDLQELELLARRPTLSPEVVARRLRVSARWLRTEEARRMLPIVRRLGGSVAYDRPAYLHFLSARVVEASAMTGAGQLRTPRSLTRALVASNLTSVEDLGRDIDSVAKRSRWLLALEQAVKEARAERSTPMLIGKYEIEVPRGAGGTAPRVNSRRVIITGDMVRAAIASGST